MKSKSYLYIVECGGFVKIGSAANALKRIKTLAIGNPFPIKLLCIYEFPQSYMSRSCEHIVHVYLAERGNHFTGEWFKGIDDKLLMYIEKIALNYSRDCIKHEELPGWDPYKKIDPCHIKSARQRSGEAERGND